MLVSQRPTEHLQSQWVLRMMDDRIGGGVVVGLTARSWRRLHKKGKGCRENRVQAESGSRGLNEEWVT